MMVMLRLFIIVILIIYGDAENQMAMMVLIFLNFLSLQSTRF
jgi:hypothetical protein